jgi:Spy/CpxP family protein refolding chaperone
MAIDFPDTPTTGDTHTVGSKTWRYDGEKWVILNETANQQNQLYDIMVLMNMETP